LLQQQLADTNNTDTSSRQQSPYPTTLSAAAAAVVITGRILLYHALVFFLWAEYAALKTRYRCNGMLLSSNQKQRCIQQCILPCTMIHMHCCCDQQHAAPVNRTSCGLSA
jgi:hypothetical protein